jgi:anti-sigma regulatory factor (Ser/Thr protein kinase)
MPYYRCPKCGLLSHSVAGYSTAGVCANCSAALPAEAKLDVVSEPTTAVNRNIRAGLSAPAQARRVMSGLPVDETVQNRLALVVSELVTNSLRHAGLAAGDPIELRATRDNGTVLISVHDGGPGFEPRERRAEAPAGGGAGLSIVDSLADRWGVDQSPDGCTVWCLVATS